MLSQLGCRDTIPLNRVVHAMKTQYPSSAHLQVAQSTLISDTRKSLISAGEDLVGVRRGSLCHHDVLVSRLPILSVATPLLHHAPNLQHAKRAACSETYNPPR